MSDLNQYEKLWVDIIDGIDPDHKGSIPYQILPVQEETLFEARCKWNDRSYKMMVGKFKGTREEKLHLMFSRFPERTWDVRPQWDIFLIDEVLSDTEYADKKDLGIQLFKLEDEVFTKYSQYDGVECDLLEIHARNGGKM